MHNQSNNLPITGIRLRYQLPLLFLGLSLLAGNSNAQVFDQVNGPPGPGPFFWVLDDIGWYWTPAEDVSLISIQTQLRDDFPNLDNDFIFTTKIYSDRPAVGGVEIASTDWNGAYFVDGPWVGGFFDAPVELQGGTEYFIGMSGWAQAVGVNSGAGVNWVDDPLGDPAENLGEGSSYGSSAGNPGSFDTQFSPNGLGATDQPVLRFLESTASGNVEVLGYDINDAILSGFGNWSHNYSATITTAQSFSHFSNPGTFAFYSGIGDGTLNDGFISETVAGSQLFLREANNVTNGETEDNDPNDNIFVDPKIFLTLLGSHTIDNIDLYGGNIPSNAIPGLITSVLVEILDTNFDLHAETISTVPFGNVTNSLGIQVNDRICLRGTTLEGIEAVAIFLSNFEGDFELASGFGPALTEILVYGNAIPGDVNRDGNVNLLDVDPFISAISSGEYDAAADINGDCAVDLLDINGFIQILGGG